MIQGGCLSESEMDYYAYEEPAIDANLIVEVKYYPNPASKQLNLEVQLSSLNFLEWTIYTMQGQPILNNKTEEQGYSFNEQIGVGDLKPGVHLLHIKAGDEQLVRPVHKDQINLNRGWNDQNSKSLRLIFVLQ